MLFCPLIEDPVIEKVNRTGYPKKEQEPVGDDFFGNEVFPGDEILVLDDEMFLIEELNVQTKEILKHLGAVEKIAE